MKHASLDARGRSLIEANRLRPDALDANRSGALTDKQARELRSRRRTRGSVMIAIALLCIAVGGWNALGPAAAGERVGAWTVLIIGAVLLAMRFTAFGRSYAAELAAGRVASVEGSIRVRHHTSNRDSGGGRDAYYYEVAGRAFPTTEQGAALIDPSARYRIYYVPDSDIMVNIEPIEGAVASSQAR